MKYGQVNKDENKYYFETNDGSKRIEVYMTPEAFEKIIDIIKADNGD